jgi:hypothetical protein
LPVTVAELVVSAGLRRSSCAFASGAWAARAAPATPAALLKNPRLPTDFFFATESPPDRSG